MNFNREGNFTNDITIASQKGNSVEFILEHSYENGKHVAKEYGGGLLLTTHIYNWTGNTSYEVISRYKNGSIDFTAKGELTSGFRDKAGEFMDYEDDTLAYGFNL